MQTRIGLERTARQRGCAPCSGWLCCGLMNRSTCTRGTRGCSSELGFSGTLANEREIYSNHRSEASFFPHPKLLQGGSFRAANRTTAHSDMSRVLVAQIDVELGDARQEETAIDNRYRDPASAGSAFCPAINRSANAAVQRRRATLAGDQLLVAKVRLNSAMSLMGLSSLLEVSRLRRLRPRRRIPYMREAFSADDRLDTDCLAIWAAWRYAKPDLGWRTLQPGRKT